jgi:hypothetical protein
MGAWDGDVEMKKNPNKSIEVNMKKRLIFLIIASPPSIHHTDYIRDLLENSTVDDSHSIIIY